jgi:hypothetical protein
MLPPGYKHNLEVVKIEEPEASGVGVELSTKGLFTVKWKVIDRWVAVGGILMRYL